ncbi:MAG: 16S rRNA (cytidine(1402)-2'-O)-methyltransferase [Clostridiales bacterium]|nr:16S rRNA (cytidine(1402)-2'-O)-methyltransferase [Clostridiales bacterium]
MSGTLYVVGTPIGNLGDLSPRALDILEKCDFIAAEDTRVTLKLLNHFGIKKALVSYHEHNRFAQGGPIAERILSGENCALVTDAGMPAISDPGEDLVRLCHEKGIRVESVPGPTAFATAVAISGMPSGRFTFEGFLSVNKVSRKEHLESLADEKRTMVFYEAPHKLPRTLADMAECFGDRKIALIKELTKIHETVERTSLFAARDKYLETPPKGEYVIVIEGKPEEKKTVSLEEAVEMAKQLRENGVPVSDAAKTAAKKTGLKKGDIYKELI